MQYQTVVEYFNVVQESHNFNKQEREKSSHLIRYIPRKKIQAARMSSPGSARHYLQNFIVNDPFAFHHPGRNTDQVPIERYSAARILREFRSIRCNITGPLFRRNIMSSRLPRNSFQKLYKRSHYLRCGMRNLSPRTMYGYDSSTKIRHSVIKCNKVNKLQAILARLNCQPELCKISDQ